MAEIHPSAVVESGAELASDVVIGPFCYVGPKVRLGAGTVLHHHASVEGNTVMGERNEVFPHANIGGKTQDLKYKGGEPPLIIGNGNRFRECVTVHTATVMESETRMGDNNLLLAYCHVAHDCVLGSGIIMSNNATLAGHVHVADEAVLMGFAAVHQFCRIGQFGMIGACSKCVQDVPPFMIADGNPAEVRTINKVKLQRAGATDDDLGLARRLFKSLYRDGLNRSQAVEKIEAMDDHPYRTLVLDFIASSERGLA